MEKICAACQAIFIVGTTVASGKNKVCCSKSCAQKLNGIKYSTTHSLGKEHYLVRFGIRHGSKYDYLQLPDTIVSKTELTIKCPHHGEFKQAASNHLNHGCKRCKADKISTAHKGNPKRLALLTANGNKRKPTSLEFIQRAILVHGDSYDYSKLIYVDRATKVEIGCKIHGFFWQNTGDHVHGGNGCPKCGHTRRKMQNDWLDSLGIPDAPTHREVKIKLLDGSLIFADGFDSASNTIYEFWGDYFHGNPAKYKPSDINTLVNKSFGELYEATIAKKHAIVASGFNLIEMWEFDYPK